VTRYEQIHDIIIVSVFVLIIRTLNQYAIIILLPFPTTFLKIC